MRPKVTYSTLRGEWLVFDADADRRRDWACDPTSVVFAAPTAAECDDRCQRLQGLVR